MKEKMYAVLILGCGFAALVCFSDLFGLDTKYLNALSHPSVEVMQTHPKYLKKKHEPKVVPTATPSYQYPNHTLSEHADLGSQLYPIDSPKVVEVPTSLPANPAPSARANFERSEPVTRTR
jgi:hypothetical protein